MALGDRIAVMEKGRIAQIGTPQEIYYRPQTAFVADFIGTMNRVAGRADGAGLEVPGGRLPWRGPVRERQEVLFRPEDLRIANGAEVHLRGTIAAAFFLGDHAAHRGYRRGAAWSSKPRASLSGGEACAAVNPRGCWRSNGKG
jgi:putative spermidine/putrescine transport system ATP-binding protein